MTPQAWLEATLPRLDGRRALVTGAASGLGLETAQGLARRGAAVILADVNREAGAQAAQRLRDAGAAAEFRGVDLADAASVRALAAGVDGTLDLLVNNAGILPPLQRRATAAGHELAFAISVLGHFALTGLLLPALRRAAGRVVWVSSLVHRHAVLELDDLHGERRYRPQAAYNQAKLASLVLALELHARDLGVASLAAHPGIARTAIGESRKGQARITLADKLTDVAFALAMRGLGQPQQMGALPILHAAAAPGVASGEFYGPDGLGEMRGWPKRVAPSAPALDPPTRERLWRACEAMTGVSY